MIIDTILSVIIKAIIKSISASAIQKTKIAKNDKNGVNILNTNNAFYLVCYELGGIH